MAESVLVPAAAIDLAAHLRPGEDRSGNRITPATSALH
jgi:hypothetical protein